MVVTRSAASPSGGDEPATASSGRLGRRALLGGAVASASLLAACRWTDPVVHSARHDTGASATPDDAPDADRLRAADDEQALAATLLALGRLGSAPVAVKRWAAPAARAHLAAAGRLRQRDLWAAPPPGAGETRSPAPPASDVKAALAAVRRASTDLSHAHVARAGAAPDGPTALLWASLAVTASSQSGPTTPMVLRDSAPVSFDPGTPAEAEAVLLQQLYAACQAYEAGLGVIPSRHPDRTPAQTRLTDLLADVAAVETTIRHSGATPPPVRPGYQLGTRPTGPGSARALFVLSERALLDAHARQVAAQPVGQRGAQLTALLQQVPHAQGWAGAIVQWPGWA